MDKEKIELEEQKAPVKNTDHAFVQVNKDGSPQIPDTGKSNEEEQKDHESRGLEHR